MRIYDVALFCLITLFVNCENRLQTYAMKVRKMFVYVFVCFLLLFYLFYS